ncbi:MAG TPA: MBL fold metallo-hydrolase [Pirellulaceae bacterium]|nr:MBL fold metallo-hydrolase [Pirellulaceae bacterium]
MRLIVHRGTHEIGGSCVELATDTTRIVVDVGLPLVDADRNPFDQTSVRDKTIEELLADGTLPAVEGLFTPGRRPDAILLSHSHLDHAGLLHLTDADVPIYASSGTSKMMLAGALFSRQRSLDRNRHRQIKSGESFEVGDFAITPYAVDHSSFGSMAFVIEAEDRSVLYSGDLRRHGRKAGMLKGLIAAVAPRAVDVLLMEGTHFGSDRPKGQTEYDLEEEIVRLVRDAPALTLACFSPIDVDRLVTYYRAAKRTDRTFVVDAYAAFVMHLASGEASIPRPRRDAGIRVFFNRAFRQRRSAKIAELFEADRISLDEILAEPAKYLMAFRPSMTDLDFDGTLPPRTRCLYSYWKGYLDRDDWRRLQSDLHEVDGDFIPCHASGHIYVDDLVSFVEAVSPKHVVPIHTFEPELYRERLASVRVMNDGEVLVVE